jgi:leucyl/phenylalanyl-tRNA---protein transferase
MRRASPHSPTPPDDIVELFLSAYRVGAFPMADVPARPRRDGRMRVARMIRWYSPDPRSIIELGDGGLHIGRTVARTIKRRPFTLTSDRAFERVIRACADPGPTRGGPWLDASLISCYTLLHEEGHAHSIEAWGPGAVGPVLLGGIYGVSMGSAFFAESMFTAIDQGGTGASTVCLVALWNHLRACGYQLLDVQMANDHTRRFGVVDIPREEYLRRLASAIEGPDRWRPLADQA